MWVTRRLVALGKEAPPTRGREKKIEWGGVWITRRPRRR